MLGRLPCFYRRFWRLGLAPNWRLYWREKLDKSEKPAKAAKPKLSAEERSARRKEALAKARAVKKAEKEKYDALVAALAESGKTVDELLDALKK